MANPRRKEEYFQVQAGSVQKNVKTDGSQVTANKFRMRHHDPSFSDLPSKTVTNQTRSKSVLRLQSATPPEIDPLLHAHQQQFYWNQQQLLQSDLHSAAVAIQSLINQNNSRTDTVALGMHATTLSMSPVGMAVNINANAMTSFEKRSSPHDLQRRKKSKSSGKHKNKKKKGKGKGKGDSQSVSSGESNSGDSKASPNGNQGDDKSSSNDQTLVEVKVIFVRIMDIDTINQQFEAEVYIQARWVEDQFSGFSEEDISIIVSSERTLQELELVFDCNQISNVSQRAMQGNQEWNTYRHVEFMRDFNTMETLSSTKHPILAATAHAKRKLGFYFWNIFLIVMLILALGFAILAIEPYMEERLLAMITLFLTTIAFKLVLKATLPQISYLTYLDIYVVFALIYLTLQAIENAIMIHLKKFKTNESIQHYDKICQGCLIALLIIFHLVLIIYIQITALSRRRSMRRKELEFELQMAKINQSKTAPPQSANPDNAQLKQTQTNNNSQQEKPQDKQEPVEVKNPLFGGYFK